MKTKRILPGAGLALAVTLVIQPAALVRAATTIDAANHYAFGANLGWLDWRGDVANGAIVGDYVCSGYLYTANVGWINLGSGSPTNGIRYQNLAASDFGVNHDGVGNLRGYAWAANIGWVAFEDTGAATVDLATGKLGGYAYSANCGWISLSNALAFVRTDTLASGADTDADGIPDAWELEKFGNLTTANGSSDFDGDGSSDAQEYLADTDPRDSNDSLRITCYTRVAGTNTLWWTSEPTRYYAVQEEPVVALGSNWVDYVVMPTPGANSASLDGSPSTQNFYRIRAFRPLMP